MIVWRGLQIDEELAARVDAPLWEALVGVEDWDWFEDQFEDLAAECPVGGLTDAVRLAVCERCERAILEHVGCLAGRADELRRWV